MFITRLRSHRWCHLKLDQVKVLENCMCLNTPAKRGMKYINFGQRRNPIAATNKDDMETLEDMHTDKYSSNLHLKTKRYDVKDLNEYILDLTDDQGFSPDILFLLFSYLFQRCEKEVPTKIVESLVMTLSIEKVPSGTKSDLLRLLLIRLTLLNTGLSPGLTEKMYSTWVPYLRDAFFVMRLKEMEKFTAKDPISPALLSLKAHVFIANEEYGEVLPLISQSKGKIDSFIIDLLAYHLVAREEMDLLHDLIELIKIESKEHNNGEILFSSQVLQLLFRKSVELKRLDIAMSLFLPLVYYASYPRFQLTQGMLSEATNLATVCRNYSALDKLGLYNLKLLSQSHANSDEKKNIMKRIKEARVWGKFKGYVQDLGAREMINNGMFAKHQRFNLSPISPLDLVTFKESLKEYYLFNMSETKKLIHLPFLVRLLRQLNNQNTRPFQQRFAKGIHPSEQINRIIAKRNTPLNVSVQVLRERFPEGNYKLGKPFQVSHSRKLAKRRRKEYGALDVAFTPLSANLLLSLIESLATNKDDLSEALLLTKVCLLYKGVVPNSDTLLYLIKIAEDSQNVSSILKVIEAFPDIPLDLRCFKLVFDIFIRTKRLDDLFHFLDAYCNEDMIISNYMYRELEAVCKEHNDTRYEEFRPTLFTLPDLSERALSLS